MEKWNWQAYEVGLKRKWKRCNETKKPLEILHSKGYGEGFPSFVKAMPLTIDEFLSLEVRLDEYFVDEVFEVTKVKRGSYARELTEMQAVKLCCAAVYVVVKTVNCGVDDAMKKKNILKVHEEVSKEDVDNLLKPLRTAYSSSVPASILFEDRFKKV